MPVPPEIVEVDPPARNMPPDAIVRVCVAAKVKSAALALLILSVLMLAVVWALIAAVVITLELAVKVPARVVPPAWEARKFVSVP